MEKTTITISKGTKAQLDALKAHPRQSYEEIIVKLLEMKGEGQKTEQE